MKESINGHVRIQSIFALIFHDNLNSLLSHLRMQWPPGMKKVLKYLDYNPDIQDLEL